MTAKNNNNNNKNNKNNINVYKNNKTIGSDYFTEKFQVKENKTKMKHTYLRIFFICVLKS